VLAECYSRTYNSFANVVIKAHTRVLQAVEFTYNPHTFTTVGVLLMKEGKPDILPKQFDLDFQAVNEEGQVMVMTIQGCKQACGRYERFATPDMDQFMNFVGHRLWPWEREKPW